MSPTGDLLVALFFRGGCCHELALAISRVALTLHDVGCGTPIRVTLDFFRVESLSNAVGNCRWCCHSVRPALHASPCFADVGVRSSCLDLLLFHVAWSPVCFSILLSSFSSVLCSLSCLALFLWAQICHHKGTHKHTCIQIMLICFGNLFCTLPIVDCT